MTMFCRHPTSTPSVHQPRLLPPSPEGNVPYSVPLFAWSDKGCLKNSQRRHNLQKKIKRIGLFCYQYKNHILGLCWQLKVLTNSHCIKTVHLIILGILKMLYYICNLSTQHISYMWKFDQIQNHSWREIWCKYSSKQYSQLGPDLTGFHSSFIYYRGKMNIFIITAGHLR